MAGTVFRHVEGTLVIDGEAETDAPTAVLKLFFSVPVVLSKVGFQRLRTLVVEKNNWKL